MPQKLRIVILLNFALLVFWGNCASAHEFWVAPKEFTVQLGDVVNASLLVGQSMQGKDYPYLSYKFQSLQVASPSGIRDLSGTNGQTPAISFEPGEPGLHVISYHSRPSEISYRSWEGFTNYLHHEGMQGIAKRHQDRGLPESGFKESYRRFAKSLVQVGSVRVQDSDHPHGGPLELVAIDNPYGYGIENLSVVLLRDGKPVADRQIRVTRNDGEIQSWPIVTDERGQASIPVDRGGEFLLSAVDLQPVDKGAIVWESYWASLTFGIPVRLHDLHPLDPLSAIELGRAVQVIGASDHANKRTRISLLTLAEPDKQTMLDWEPDKSYTRRAFAVVVNDGAVFEADIDLVGGTLERWQAVPDVQPSIRSDEWALAQRLLKEDPRWIAAMKDRGIEQFSNIFCESLSAGFFDLPEERGKRLLKMPCYDRTDNDIHIYGRPIEGLVGIVDLNAREVLRVTDTGVVPTNSANHDFGENLMPPREPAAEARQSEVPYTLDGRVISWRDWSFHLGFDQRFGPMLSLVTHRDGDRRRSILYEGHLSEIFVPYMDSSEGWYYRAYMDAGEYGLGLLASPLSAGTDCPDGATYFSATLASPLGAPYTRDRVMCVFERVTTEPLWRHWEALNGQYSGRLATELVVRSVPSLANYDYVVDWVFTQSGEIQVNIGATGIDAVKGVATRNMNDKEAPEDTSTGMLVSPNLVAVYHDHFFSIRLDLDVDGPQNSFVRERLVAKKLPRKQPRRSLWQLESQVMDEEGGLSMRQGPELWRLENPGEQTTLGHRPSYQLSGTSNATSLLLAKDWPQRRAAFSGETLWLTARHSGERSAAGPYPNQGSGETGVAQYANGERLESNDLVAWYTLGFHHLTRPEDWPVLPTMWHQLKLRPYGFFEQNPSVEAESNGK